MPLQVLKLQVNPNALTSQHSVGKLVCYFPTVKRLNDRDLLKRCTKMGTQNANESFNSLIWKRSPKNEFHSRSSVETSTSLATLSFNCGPFGLHTVFEKLDLSWEKCIHEYCTAYSSNSTNNLLPVRGNQVFLSGSVRI